jgi:hypothetical protein
LLGGVRCADKQRADWQNSSQGGGGCRYSPEAVDIVVDVEPAQSLPPAPSEFHVYADRGAIRSLLANDFQKLMKIGSAVEGRYGEAVAFRVKQRPGIRAVCVVPTSNSLWHHTKLLKDRESLESNPPEQAGCTGRALQYKSGHGFFIQAPPLYSGHNFFWIWLLFSSPTLVFRM